MARTVLLADDSVTAQNMGRRILTDAGYEVITVNNGSAALKKIHESRPDLIVLDVYMPGYGGLEVCQRLKESEATMRIPVLLTVGKMEPFKTDEAKRVRADGHIIKPFDASELLAALTRLEDRIVPQAESGRGKSSKSEPKKSRRLRDEEIGADEEDGSRKDRISYLEEMKKRHAKSFDETSGQAATDNSLTGIERQARMAPEDAEEAVTFAAGPIYEPSASSSVEPQKVAPEFPVEKAAESEEPQTENSKTPSEQETKVAEIKAEKAWPAPATEAVSEAPEERSKPVETAAETTAEPEPAPKVESAPRWVAENVALSAEEAARSLDEEMRQAKAASEPVADQEQRQESVKAESQEEASQAEDKDQEKPAQSAPEADSSGAAFAAAASASGSSTTADAVGNNSTSEAAPAPEAAAALENWERIRDTVVGQQAAEAIAQSVAAMAENVASAGNETPAQPEPNASSQVAGDAAEPQKPAAGDPLSSIVDNVLAELKPRLLAEIAKQLASDKK